MKLTCNEIFLLLSNVVPSTSRKQGTTGRYLSIHMCSRQHIDHFYISGYVYHFNIISNDRYSFYKATLAILLKKSTVH